MLHTSLQQYFIKQGLSDTHHTAFDVGEWGFRESSV